MRLAAEIDNFVRIDMEDSSTTDETLRTYRELREGRARERRRRAPGVPAPDVDDIGRSPTLGPDVALARKGIYLEPEEIAFTGFEEIRETTSGRSRCCSGADAFVASRHTTTARLEGQNRRGALVTAYEFQMLLGVRQPLATSSSHEGQRLRIYVPFGRQWYDLYSMRRLQENPRIAGYVATDTLRPPRPGRNGSALRTSSARAGGRCPASAPSRKTRRRADTPRARHG